MGTFTGGIIDENLLEQRPFNVLGLSSMKSSRYIAVFKALLVPDYSILVSIEIMFVGYSITVNSISFGSIARV